MCAPPSGSVLFWCNCKFAILLYYKRSNWFFFPLPVCHGLCGYNNTIRIWFQDSNTIGNRGGRRSFGIYFPVLHHFIEPLIIITEHNSNICATSVQLAVKVQRARWGRFCLCVLQLVAGSVVMAFEEVCPDRIDLIHKNYRKLCNLLVDVEEWGQVVIISMLTRYARTQFTSPWKEVCSVLGWKWSCTVTIKTTFFFSQVIKRHLTIFTTLHQVDG